MDGGIDNGWMMDGWVGGWMDGWIDDAWAGWGMEGRKDR